MKTNKELLAVAVSQLGNTGGKYRSYVGEPGSWCDMFVYWLFHANGCGELLNWTTKAQKINCPESIKWCQKNLAEIPPYLAMACDLVYYDWDKNGRPNHIGIVESHWDNNKIHAIEGNTSGGKVARKDRKTYIQAVFRPHFAPTNLKKDTKLAEDSICGYNTIAAMEKWLGLPQTGILTREVVIALQKKVGATPDAAWGAQTSKKLQKVIGAGQDGDFYKNSVLKLQQYLNKVLGYTKTAPKKTTPAVNPKAQAAVDWGKKIAKSGKYKYKKWNNKKKNTKLCPICHPGSGNGWNCIGYVSACWFHGANVKDVTCSCSGIGTDSFFTKVTLASWQKRNGKNWTMITNGGSKGGSDIPASKLLPGDTLICYDKNGKFKHIAIYSGNGKILESTKTRTPNVGERTYKDLCGRHHVTRAFRYTG